MAAVTHAPESAGRSRTRTTVGITGARIGKGTVPVLAAMPATMKPSGVAAIVTNGPRLPMVVVSVKVPTGWVAAEPRAAGGAHLLRTATVEGVKLAEPIAHTVPDECTATRDTNAQGPGIDATGTLVTVTAGRHDDDSVSRTRTLKGVGDASVKYDTAARPLALVATSAR